jgi:hypothetical protein
MLQRPPTLRELVFRSILRLRDAADTLVDREEVVPQAALDGEDRVTDIDLPAAPRASQASVVFDLVSPRPA